jgi:sec-independent protein translocase protein TatA
MMGSLSPIHWIIILVVAALLFGGRGKLSGLMGDAAKGIKAFRDGMKDDDPSHAAATPTQPLPPVAAPVAAAPVAAPPVATTPLATPPLATSGREEIQN